MFSNFWKDGNPYKTVIISPEAHKIFAQDTDEIISQGVVDLFRDIVNAVSNNLSEIDVVKCRFIGGYKAIQVDGEKLCILEYIYDVPTGVAGVFISSDDEFICDVVSRGSSNDFMQHAINSIIVIDGVNL